MTWANLGNLKSLDLSHNRLDGRIDQISWENLDNLRELDLSENLLKGEIPGTIGDLGSLERLDLGHNGLSGEIPEELVKLTNLRVLDISHQDQFRGLELASANTGGADPVLALAMQMEESYLYGDILWSWDHITNLEALNLNGNWLYGEIPVSLSWLDKLEWLGLQGNQLSGRMPKWIGDVPWEVLDLYDNNFYGCIPLSAERAKALSIVPGVRGLPDELCKTPEELALEAALSKEARGLLWLYILTEGEEWNSEQSIAHDDWDFEKLLSSGSAVSLEGWYGISLDDQGFVIGLDLNDNNLNGTIPRDLAEMLPKLQWLRIEGNSLRSCIPSGLSEALLYGETDPTQLEDPSSFSEDLRDSMVVTGVLTGLEILVPKGDAAASVLGGAVSQAEMVKNTYQYSVIKTLGQPAMSCLTPSRSW